MGSGIRDETKRAEYINEVLAETYQMHIVKWILPTRWS